jgi:hypothetical protein
LFSLITLKNLSSTVSSSPLNLATSSFLLISNYFKISFYVINSLSKDSVLAIDSLYAS